MAEILPTVEIHSPKDASQRWLINESEFDPAKHRLWGDEHNDDSLAEEPEMASVAVMDAPPERTGRNVPSNPDYVTNDDGEVIAVNIIDPDRRNARKEVPFEAYDPDTHELWSTHPRFNR